MTKTLLTALLAIILSLFSTSANVLNVPESTDPNDNTATSVTDTPANTAPTASDATPHETKTVTAEEALAAALAHAGLTRTDVYDVDVELDKEKNGTHYDVDFETKDAEYDYDVSASDGSILKQWKEDKKVTPPATTEPTTPAPTPTASVSAEEALTVALTHAGVTKDVISFLEIDLDKDNRIKYYDIEFNVDRVEYEYEINIETGEILKAEKNDKDILNPTTSTSYITKEEALEKALTHAGLTKDAVYGIEVEFDGDDRVKNYEVSFKQGRWEYDYKINAETGEILVSEKEIDD